MASIRPVDLSRVQLRPTKTRDKSYPDTSLRAFENNFVQDKHEKNFLDVGMEHWLPHVVDLTFATVCVPLDLEQAKTIRAAYSYLHAGDEAASWAVASSATTATTLPPELLARLVTIGVSLAPSVNALVEQKGAVFAKLSGRSAKDAPLYTRKLDDAFQAHLEEKKKARGTNQAVDDNTQLICLFDAALSLAKVRDVGHLLWNLVNSHRVDEDLDVAIRHPERWDQAVVIREWWEGVTTDLEFRLFIVDGTPTGLTQYNHLIYSERCASRGEKIASSLHSFYVRHVRPRLEGTRFFAEVAGRFTCDLALAPGALPLLDDARETLPELTPEHVKLVELNAFYEATGMGMFDYHTDEEVLNKGPFEWRMRMEPLPHAAVKLENEWRRLLKPVPEARRTTDEAWAAIGAALAKSCP